MLEAVAALTVLTAVAIICMQLRVQASLHAADLAEHAQAQRAAESILDLAIAGLLPAGESRGADDPLRTITWKGERLGQPYTCIRERVRLQNPVVGEPGVHPETVSPIVEMDQFTVQCAGVELSALRPVRQ